MGSLSGQLAPADAGTVLLGMGEEELAALAVADGQPGYRGKQLGDGVRNGARALQDIANVRHRPQPRPLTHLTPPRAGDWRIRAGNVEPFK